MKFKKLTNLLLEMPAKNIKKIGGDDEWRNRGAYDKKSFLLLTDPNFEQSLRKAFSKSDVDINFYFVNKKALSDFDADISSAEHGELNPKNPTDVELLNLLGVNYDEIVDEDAITVIYNGNFGDALVPLTPWTIAHRLSHAIYASRRTSYSVDASYKGIEDTVGWLLEELIDIYRLSSRVDSKRARRWPDLFQKGYEIIAIILSSIFTFKSARDKKLIRPAEALHELIAQYLITGDVRLVDTLPPINIRQADEYEYEYGYSDDDYTYNPHFNPDSEIRDDWESLKMSTENAIVHYINDVLYNAVGGVYLI